MKKREVKKRKKEIRQIKGNVVWQLYKSLPQWMSRNKRKTNRNKIVEWQVPNEVDELSHAILPLASAHRERCWSIGQWTSSMDDWKYQHFAYYRFTRPSHEFNARGVRTHLPHRSESRCSTPQREIKIYEWMTLDKINMSHHLMTTRREVPTRHTVPPTVGHEARP
jgi:hypothetical protein